MVKKKNIAIVAGGYTSEYEVSLRSAEGIAGFIDNDRYKTFIVVITQDSWTVRLPEGREAVIDKNDFSFINAAGRRTCFDFAYITIHGAPGEDGRLQGYFDMIGLSHSSCRTLASALTFNKFVTNQFLHSQGLSVADAVRLQRGESITAAKLLESFSLPVFVKPNEGGSSFGITKVKEASQLQEAIRSAFDESDEVIIESYVAGTEVTCGCYKTKSGEHVFPVTEVVTHNEFFDYNAKYKGEVEEITPARISPELTEIIQRSTSRIYDLLGARGIIRIDYIIPHKSTTPVLLEVNTNPGMTATSFIPQQIRAAGLDIKDVMTEIIEN
jgi:D-alanine-D-alanine ligase